MGYIAQFRVLKLAKTWLKALLSPLLAQCGCLTCMCRCEGTKT